MTDNPDNLPIHEGDDAGVANPFGGAGMPDLGGLLQSAQQMMANAQAAADEVVEGSAGGGLVTVRLDGHFTFHGVSIDAGAIDPEDTSLLEDLVLAVLRDATAEVQSGQQGALGGLDLPGLDGLGDLGGLLGGGE